MRVNSDPILFSFESKRPYSQSCVFLEADNGSIVNQCTQFHHQDSPGSYHNSSPHSYAYDSTYHYPRRILTYTFVVINIFSRGIPLLRIASPTGCSVP